MKSGFECGIALEGFEDVREGDVIEAFQKVFMVNEPDFDFVSYGKFVQ